MNTYWLERGSVYAEITEDIGVPFRVIGPYAEPFTPWGTRVSPLGEDVTVGQVAALQDHSCLTTGHLFAVVQVRPRSHPIQLGEFFVPDLMYHRYTHEIVHG